ncbi:MAG: hypothetical protein ABJC87_00830, partial [Roseobacter sp.]
QYKLINEFPLSEQSRSWAAFGNASMRYLDRDKIKYAIRERSVGGRLDHPNVQPQATENHDDERDWRAWEGR